MRVKPFSTRYRRDDRGVSAVLFALLLTAIMAVSAMAVDLGQAYAERRHDQNTVDAAVMSGLVAGVLDGGVVDTIVDEVRQKVDTTLARTVTDEEWEACTDGEALEYTTRELQTANPVISPVTDCISFSITFEQIRVKLPAQEVDGVFGPALGFGNISTSASANAEIDGAAGGLPFVALSTATTGDFVCLRTSSAKEPLPLANGNGPGVPATYPVAGAADARPDPCDTREFSTSSENFGTLKPFRYTDNCSQQNSDVEIAISIGMDHPMGVFPHGYYETPPVPPSDDSYKDYQVRYDGAPFTGSVRCTSAFPNTFEVDEGLNAGGLSCALVRNAGDLCNDVVPRFQQTGTYAETHSYKLLDIAYFDNSTPWQFLRNSQDLADEGSPQACVDVAASRTAPTDPADPGYWENYDRYDALVTCLKQWGQETSPGSGVYYPENELFTEDMGYSARFGFVPKVYETSLSGINYVHVEGFVPVFMYRVYIQESGSMCDPADTRDGSGLKVHDAGQEWDCGGSNKTIDRLSSVIFACGMVPASLCNKDTGEPLYAGKDIYEFRLVK